MPEQSEIKSQCAFMLKELLPDLSAKDKKEAALKFKLKGSGIYKYLQGDIGDVDTGLNLVDFLSDRVAKRKARLSQILPKVKDSDTSKYTQVEGQTVPGDVTQ